tara:strand:- start:115 stop:381 length:267 start_codon:yes stop_codon:yes gene_type:complete
MSCKKFSFNNIANVISIVSGVSLAGIIGAGTFVYVNKDAIIDNVKQQAIEAVMGSMGGGLGGSLPTGANDLSVPDNSASIPSSGIPNF